MKPMPITYVWDIMHSPSTGELRECMVPLPRYEHMAKQQFGALGSQHTLEVTRMRNMASHRQYYAELREAYDNLPEHHARKYPTIEHFRKTLLILEGFCESDVFPFVSAEEADRKQHAFGKRDPFCIVYRDENVVTVHYAKSQDLYNMKAEEFESSKRRVLARAASMISVPVGELRRNAGKSA